jgi:hypothetical protein
VWVNNCALKERFSEYSSHIVVIPNHLDERLLVPDFKAQIVKYSKGG